MNSMRVLIAAALLASTANVARSADADDALRLRSKDFCDKEMALIHFGAVKDEITDSRFEYPSGLNRFDVHLKGREIIIREMGLSIGHVTALICILPGPLIAGLKLHTVADEECCAYESSP